MTEKKKWDTSQQLLDAIEEISKLFAERNEKVENALRQGNEEKFIEAARETGIKWRQEALELLFKTLQEAYEMAREELPWAPT